jgi:predicted metal-dependent hydrolase
MLINFLDDFYGKTRPRTKRNPMGIKKPKPKLLPEITNWQIEDKLIPVELYRDAKRTGWRYSFGKNNVLLVRIPKLVREREAELLQEIQIRFIERMKKKPALYDYFNPRKYHNADIVTVGSREYTLKMFIEARKDCTGRLLIQEGIRYIDMRVDAYMDEKPRQKAIGTIISRIVAADALPEFSRRVDELNDKFFQQTIKNIRFKQNHTNWGSCSSTGNLNFSSRLLFAPQIVQDYVIVHELAHLVELNHSDRFWAIVAKVMPDYEDQEMWLKLNAAACRY